MKQKIIATIGKKTESYEMLKALTLAGMDIARINFSHATYEQWNDIREKLKKIKEETGKDVKMMMDLQGPRIRVGVLPHELHLNENEVYCFSSRDADIEKKEIPIDHEELVDDVKLGDPFYLSNGSIEMNVTEIKDKKICARVERGGFLASRKGINVPKTHLSGGGFTPKDAEDAKFGAENGADFICLSFVQTPDDVRNLKNLLGDKKIPVIAKIERANALDVIDDIIKNSDGIMVARGDLGIEVPYEDLPIIQKDLIRHAHWHEKPAIVATEMLASMSEKPKPTRAEVADVANAIFDGADAVMLSDETAVGNYPIEAVTVMHKVVDRTDNFFNTTNYFDQCKVGEQSIKNKL
ncbi:MAG: pyruvate kinase [Patescibacteria group bacterium]|nr:pyruvate kinase [Patescibacteria group bacterium]